MKAFIAYRSTGEDPKQVEPQLVAIRDGFKAREIEVYSTFFDEDKIKTLSTREIFDYTFGIIDSADFLFVLQTSDNKSEGMLIEVGYCLAKKIPIIVATKDTVTQTYLPAAASQSFSWKAIEDLTSSISELQF